MWSLCVSIRVYWFNLTCHINKTIRTLTTIAIIIEWSRSGGGAGRLHKGCGERNKNTMSSEYSITRGVGNRRGWQKTRVVSPVMGQAGCPGLEPDCLKPAGTWVGVSARMYNDLNSLWDRNRKGTALSLSQSEFKSEVNGGGSESRHAGTGEGISACVHVANSHVDRAKEGRRRDHKHSANSWWCHGRLLKVSLA